MKQKKNWPCSMVFHCFTGTKDEARHLIELGVYISFSGVLTFKNAEPVRDAAKIVPIDRLLIETDCPFLAPVPYRGKPNEPSYICQTLECLSNLRGESPEFMSEKTFENACRLFRVDFTL